MIAENKSRRIIRQTYIVFTAAINAREDVPNYNHTPDEVTACMRTRDCLPYAECTKRAKCNAASDPRKAARDTEHCTNWTKGRKKGRKEGRGISLQRRRPQTNDAATQRCANGRARGAVPVCGPPLRSRKQICVIATVVPSFLPFSLGASEAKSNDRTNGGRHIQNGFLMGGNHSPIYSHDLVTKRGRRGNGGEERR